MFLCGSPGELKIPWVKTAHGMTGVCSFLFRDWLNMLSPPIVPPSQQPAEQHQDSSGSLSAQGGNVKNAMHKKQK